MKSMYILLFMVICSSYGMAQTTPIEIFDRIWKEFDDRYSVFEERGVDWDAIYSQYRPKVTIQMSTDELYQLSCQMLAELKDGHVALIDKSQKQVRYCNSGGFPDSTTIYKLFDTPEHFWQLVDKNLGTYGFGELTTVKDFISFSKNNQIGYLRIDKMRTNKRGMDQAMEFLQDTKGLILDLRLNPGGHDQALYYFAGHFADQKRIGHYKSDRIRGKDAFKKPKPSYLKPKGSFQYTKPVIILLSDFSASASETFTQAMKQMSHVSTVGQNTHGALSFQQHVKLKNKWILRISHQKCYNAEMKIFEGSGIPPDKHIPLQPADLKKDIDAALVYALEKLDPNKSELKNIAN